MKISDQTMGILKNFSSINDNIIFQPGNRITTIAKQSEIVAVVNVSETIESEFGVYYLSQLLDAMSLFEEPIINLGDTSLTITDEAGNTNLRYMYTPKHLLTYLDRDIPDLDVVVSVDLKKDTLAELLKSAAVLGLTHLALRQVDTKLEFVVKSCGKNDGNKNEYSVVIDDNYGGTLKDEIVLKVKNINIIPGDYRVEFGSVFTKWINKDVDLQYCIALNS